MDLVVSGLHEQALYEHGAIRVVHGVSGKR